MLSMAPLAAARKTLLSTALLSSLLLLPAQTQAAPGDAVWLVATLKVQGTSSSKTLFFRNRDVTSLQQCREDIQRGRLNQWRFYNPPSDRSLAAGESAIYRCVSAPLQLTGWIRSAPYRYTYEIHIADGRMSVEPRPSLASCLSSLRHSTGKQEASLNHYCTSSSQQISR